MSYVYSVVKLHSELIPFDFTIPFREDKPQQSIGTGFLFQKSNNEILILTCAHCVNDSIRIFVTFPFYEREKNTVKMSN